MQKNNMKSITIFTPAHVELLQQALVPFEQYLTRIPKTAHNKALAALTLTSLKTKLAQMLLLQDFAPLFGLDANEVLLIYNSLTVFSCTLTLLPPSPEKEQVKEDCTKLYFHFKAVLEATHL